MMPVRAVTLVERYKPDVPLSSRLVPWATAMRKIVLKLNDGGDAGTLTEDDGGKMSGDGRAANLVKLAPNKSFDTWVENLGHSKYLTFEVQG